MSHHWHLAKRAVDRLPSLNEDVFHAIMVSALSSYRPTAAYGPCQSTVAAMMLLSRALYDLGGKLLASSEIKITTEAQLSSFVVFCTADDCSRARYVRDLILDLSRMSATGPLAELLLRMPNLSTLSITPMHSAIALQVAIASLSSIEDLTLFRGGASLSMSILANFKKPLRVSGTSSLSPAV